MKQQKRKGFTLVELLVVIAILAVLATVSIIGYTSFIKKAKISNDMALVKQINNLLLADETIDGKPATMQAALDVIEENGFLIEKLTPTAQGYDFVWNCQTNRFLLLNENQEVVAPVDAQLDKANTFVIVHNKANLDDWDAKGFNIYLADDFKLESGDAITVSHGIDVGTCTSVQTINYVTDEEQNVVIRTNDNNLTVNAPNADVQHYGWVQELNVTAVKTTHCYHEWGFVEKLMSFGTGKFVVESTALFHQTSAEIVELFVGKEYIAGADTQYEQHYYDENGVCVGCNSVNENHNHTWSIGYLSNGTDHWNICTVCGAKGQTNAHEFPVKEYGGNFYECTICHKAGEITATSASYLKIGLPSMTYYGYTGFTRTIAPGYTLIIDVSKWIANVKNENATIDVHSLEDIKVVTPGSFEVIGFDFDMEKGTGTLTITALEANHWASNSAEISIPVLKSDGSKQSATFAKTLKVWSPLLFDGKQFGPKTSIGSTGNYTIKLGEFDFEKGILVESSYLTELAKAFDTTVTWYSTDSNAVTITPDGKITNVAIGNAIIKGKVEIKTSERTYEYIVQQKIVVSE